MHAVEKDICDIERKLSDVIHFIEDTYMDVEITKIEDYY